MSNTQSRASSHAGDGFLHFLSWACIAVAGIVIIFDLLIISLERTLTLINLIWLAIAGFQITRLAAGYTAAGQ